MGGNVSGAADNYLRRGRVFSLRLEPKEEEQLKALKAEHDRQTTGFFQTGYSWGRRGGLGSFIVWAALQYKPASRR